MNIDLGEIVDIKELVFYILQRPFKKNIHGHIR